MHHRQTTRHHSSSKSSTQPSGHWLNCGWEPGRRTYPPCSPLLRGISFHPYRMLSSAYRRSRSRKDSTASEGKEKTALSGDTQVSHGNNSVAGGGLSGQGPSAHGVPGLRATSQDPPSLEPMEWTGTGRLSVLGLSPSTEARSHQS